MKAEKDMARQSGEEAHDTSLDDARHDARNDAARAAAEVELSEEELTALCRERVCTACDVMREADDLRLRALAEAENVKKRLTRETEELRKYAGETILADLLPVLDNLDLALNHASSLEACKDFVTGVDMTRRIFLETLGRHGLVAVGAKGEEFDPNVHEAVGMTADATLGDNHVAHMVQQGYLLKGRLLRPAKVMVNKIS
jgi:molecular chaperone GrpE